MTPPPPSSSPARADGDAIKMQAGAEVPIDKSLLLALGLDRKPIPGAGSSDRGGGTDKGSALCTAIFMFRLSNGPCKLAPRRPEIHIFAKDAQAADPTGDVDERSPRGAAISARRGRSHILSQPG